MFKVLLCIMINHGACLQLPVSTLIIKKASSKQLFIMDRKAVRIQLSLLWPEQFFMCFFIMSSETLLLAQYAALYQGMGEAIYYQSAYPHTIFNYTGNLSPLKPKGKCKKKEEEEGAHGFMLGNVLFFLKAIRQKYLGRRMSFVGGIAGKPGSLLLYHENIEGMHILWAFRL